MGGSSAPSPHPLGPRADSASPELRHLLNSPRAPASHHPDLHLQYPAGLSPSRHHQEVLRVTLEEADVGLHGGQEDWKADEGKLRELEQFAANFKSRRIKLGYTQTNVGK